MLKLDRLFIKILQVLQTNGRISNLDLSEEVNLSLSPCLERVRKLEEAGLITQYLAEIDLDKIGANLHIMAEITLGNHLVDDFKRFEAAITNVPEVISCYKIAGPFDYTMDMICRDIAHFNQLKEKLLAANIGIENFRGHVVMERTKTFSGYPLESLTAPSPLAQGLGFTPYIEPIHLAIKRIAADAKRLGGFADMPAVIIKHLTQSIGFGPFQDRAGVIWIARNGFVEIVGQVRPQDQTTFGKNAGIL